MHTLTTALARRIAESSWDTVNEAIGDEAVRALVNWLGCALAGSREAYYADASPEAGHASAGDDEATLLGIGDRVALPSVAALTADGADALCYADSHLPTLISPSAVVGGALLPLAESLAAPGAKFVHAWALGTEIACRAAVVLGTTTQSDPAAAAWCNALGTAAACAKLAGLDTEQAAHALDMACAAVEAATTARTDAKHSTWAGLAARSAMAAALRTRRADPIDAVSLGEAALGPRSVRADALVDGWGTVWQSSRLAYHAHPCALFLHPVVEACIQLKRTHHLTGRQIGAVCIRMHPSQATFNTGAEPASSFAAKHSVQHAATVALLDGAAGLAQFEGPKLRNGRVKEMRLRIEVVADQTLPETAAHVTITLPGDVTLERLVRCALGHPLRPLGDLDLSEKFRGLAGEALATSQAERLLGLLWNVRALPDMGGIIRTTIPEDVYEPAELPGSPLIPR